MLQEIFVDKQSTNEIKARGRLRFFYLKTFYLVEEIRILDLFKSKNNFFNNLHYACYAAENESKECDHKNYDVLCPSESTDATFFVVEDDELA